MKRLTFLAGAVLAAGCSTAAGGPQPTPTNQLGDEIVVETGGFEIPPYSEFYECWRVNIEGLNRGITRISYEPGSNAVHHVILAIDSTPEAEGNSTCPLLEVDWNVLFAGGVESDPLDVPTGVAFPLNSGTRQLVFQIHYFNPFDETITDHTTARLQLTQENAEFQNAGLLVTGSFDFEIPPFASDYGVWGTCNAPNLADEMNIFAVFPHMHQYGTHISMGITPDGSTTEDSLFDESWQFGEQPIRAVDYSFKKRDVLDVECSYNNPTNTPVDFGESTEDEMCFGFYFYYPAPTGTLPCFSAEGSG